MRTSNISFGYKLNSETKQDLRGPYELSPPHTQTQDWPKTTMTKKKELLSKAPWRGGDDDDSDKFSGAKLKVTKESDGMSKMHVPSRGTKKGSLADDEDSLEIDPQLRYSFDRNYQVSSNSLSLSPFSVNFWFHIIIFSPLCFCLRKSNCVWYLGVKL